MHRCHFILGVLLTLSTAVLGRGAEHVHSANVPPSLEIEVLDPRADSLGRPAVELIPGDCDQLNVDIPPTVLVHRYYYTGDRSFQAALLPGGPCVVVVNHPKTGERCYIEVQMLPGAPRVTYTSRSIRYDYGHHGITIHFGLLGRPKVKYRNGRTARGAISDLADHVQEVGLVRHAQTGLEHSGECCEQVVHEVHEFSSDVSGRAKQLIAFLPFGAALTSDRTEDRALERRAREVERAGTEAEREDATIPLLP